MFGGSRIRTHSRFRWALTQFDSAVGTNDRLCPEGEDMSLGCCLVVDSARKQGADMIFHVSKWLGVSRWGENIFIPWWIC
jgi:hypothetical protein